MKKINLDVMSKWVTERLTEVLGFEDEIVIGLVVNSLSDKALNPKQLQIDITGFLEKQSQPFVEELWTLLVDAQSNPHGIPQAFVEKKKRQLQVGFINQNHQIVPRSGGVVLW